jgi:transposase-like protein
MGKYSARINSLEMLQKIYPSEVQVLASFEYLRWEGQVRCAYCGLSSVRFYASQKKYKCTSCRKMFSVRVKTLFESGNLPLQKWIILLYLMLTQRSNLSSRAFAQTLGITQKSVLALQHKLNQAVEKIQKLEKKAGKPTSHFFEKPVISQTELEFWLKQLLLLKPDPKIERKKIALRAMRLSSWGKI